MDQIVKHVHAASNDGKKGEALFYFCIILRLENLKIPKLMNTHSTFITT